MERSSSRSADWPTDLVPRAGRLLVVLVAAEFLLLRVLNRLSGALPEGLRGTAGSGFAFLGTAAYDAAFLLSVLLVALVARILMRSAVHLAALAFTWVAALAAVSLLGPASPGTIVLADLVAVGLLVLVAVRGLRAGIGLGAGAPLRLFGRAVDPRVTFRFFLGAVLAADLASFYLRIGDALANLGWSPPGRTEAFVAGEALALLAAYFAALAFVRRPRRWNVFLPAVAVLLLAGYARARPDLLPLVAFWSLGFRMDLFFPLYLGAVAAFMFAVVNAWRGLGASRYGLWGLLLLGLNGRLLADLYSVQIAVVSLLFLALGSELDAIAPAKRAVRASESAGAEASPLP